MAKVAFSKLGLKKLDVVKIALINENEIEIKQYLPIEEKLKLIHKVVEDVLNETDVIDPVKLDAWFNLEMIFAYTNISFTDKQKEDIAKIYDLMSENGFINMILSYIPEDELNYVSNGVKNFCDSFTKYQYSALGIIEVIKNEAKDLEIDTEKISKNLSDPNNLTLLKDVLDKMG